MTFSSMPSRPSSSTFSTTHNPWRETPSSPEEELRRSFKSFCHMQNHRRAERGESPFCNNSGRDKAFAKLMRLSRGEEPIEWRIDPASDGEELGTDAWYAPYFMNEEGGVKIGDENEGGVKIGVENENAKKKQELTGKVGAVGHERKDSKEVASKGEHRWKTEQKAEQHVDEDEDEEMGAEYMEDVSNLM